MSIHISKERDEEFVRIAYAAVADIPTVEVNDRNRLGYHVWLYLRGELTSLADAVHQARSRYKPRTMPESEVVGIITDALERLQIPEALTPPSLQELPAEE